eukprot:Lankesteria_metandrocarpae@DN4715_c0_g1_i1.p3
MKGKKSSGDKGVGAKLQLVTKSGKYSLGMKSTVGAVRSGKAKLVLISSNCPVLRRSQLEYYAILAKINVHHFQGDNNELGTACGKLFRVSCLAITDAGDSDIVKCCEDKTL